MCIRDSVHPFAEPGGDAAGGDQHQHQRLRELFGEAAPGRFARRFGQPVGAMAEQALSRLVRAQPPRAVDAEPVGGVVRGQRVPG